MRILLAVAPVARRGNAHRINVVEMAALAFCHLVSAPERKFCILVVIEANCLPLAGRVTGLTLASIRVLVDVLQAVTARAVCRHTLVDLAGVTLVAGHLLVSVDERKLCFAVIEGGCLFPSLHIVAGLAPLSEAALVRINLFVTTNAFQRS